ncbi:PBSX family phage terminase large subunit [Candidatus Dojkabacteria bacterium]|uniref:PBSX family phage terminase large subunit n=1 Tax=Candidatus Dojkabacteria bacterium TaxID=2099670 RepID=A0A5C7JB76_9BACT|nr:MAG: PBSX family phage terminase large subunit [Candidatus Dojkabacteria bacterium]
MSVLQIQTPEVFAPLLEPARYKGVWGGRGSGKSWFFAELLLESCIIKPTRAVCIREVQKSIKQSVKLLLEDKIKLLNLERHFQIYEERIETKNGSLIIFQGMQNHTADSIKSLEGYDIAWCEEAQTISERSLRLLRPTIRKPGSELWFSWNPDNEEDPVDQLLRGPNRILEGAIVVQANYMDNPYFPNVLQQEMEIDKARDPSKYAHTWLGEYEKFAGGAVYGKEMVAAKEQGRICSVPYNPAVPVFTVWDLGYSKGNATSIGFGQMVGREPRIIDYYQNELEGIGHYLQVLKDRKYNYSIHVFPHDAGHASLRTGTTFVRQLEEMGLGKEGKDIIVLPTDSVETGIELVRQLLQQIWIDDKCTQLIRGLTKYHYEWDEERKIFGRKPYHDEHSNPADMMRYFATHLATMKAPIVRKPEESYYGGVFMGNDNGSWMG